MDEMIYKYINQDPQSINYSTEEIRKAVEMIKRFIGRLENCRIEENGKQRKLSQVEEFALIYDYVSNRKYAEKADSHSIVGALNSGYSVCEGFTKLSEVLCALRGIPFLYKHVTTGYGVDEHGNFQVIVSDNNGIKHCLHCDPTIDCLKDPKSDPEILPAEEKDTFTYNAFLIETKSIKDYCKRQEPSPGSLSTSLFWKIAVDDQSPEELKKELEDVSDEKMIIPSMMGQSKQDVINSEYARIRDGIADVSDFFGMETPNLDSNEQVLEAYKMLFKRYEKLDIPIDRNELFDSIRKVYIQNIPSKNINDIIEKRISKTKEYDVKDWNNKKDEIVNKNIQQIVYKFAGMAGIDDKKMCDDSVSRLSKLDINDSIDTILVSLNSLLNRGVLTAEQILSNADSILVLNPEKYKSSDDLIKRLQWINSMNMEYPQMPLIENHKLVLEAFDKFNGLIGTKFDSFYTGGLMGYLATNHELERYHGDLDLFINEKQLLALYSLVQQSETFEFVSNMDHKEQNGHEFKINYKGTPMSIGLFLFSRLPNEEMVLKEYFYPEQNQSNGLVVNEKHLTGDYASMLFSAEPREHNGAFYKTQSLEGIYHAKRDSRPKDRYDAQVIKKYVDMGVVRRLDTERQSNYNVANVPASGSIVEQLDSIIRNRNIDQNISQEVGHRRL